MLLNFKDKKVLVCGIALSGISASIFLKQRESFVTLYDIRTEDKVNKEDINLLKKYNITLYLGKNPYEIIKSQDLIVVSPGIPTNLYFFELARKNNIKIIGEFELASKFCNCPIIGITGTNGKTTTTEITSQIFKNFRNNVFIVGNMGVPFTKEISNISENSIVISEISSFQLELIDTFRPKIAAILNVSQDHLDRHKTFENYIFQKEKIFKNQMPDDFLILNYDNKYCREMKNKSKSKVIFFSVTEELEEGIFLKNDNIYIRLDDMEYSLISIKEVKILGMHNIENIMVASIISILMNIPKDIIFNTIKNFKGIEHRIEYITYIKGRNFYNDSKATNIDASIKSINAMVKPIILIAGGYNKNLDFSEFVSALKGKVKELVLIGETSDLIFKTCKKYNFNNVYKAKNLKEAVTYSFKISKRGDCILLSPACASWDMFDNYEHRGNLFKKFVFELRSD